MTAIHTEYYPVIFIYDNKKFFFIWETNKEDGDTFMIDKNQCVISTNAEDKLREITRQISITVHWDESCEMDFDKFWKSLGRLNTHYASSTRTCILLLDGWNLLEDLLRTFNLHHESKKLRSPILDKVYSKLFSGCNLPSVTPENSSYSPLWLSEELILLRKELRSTWHFLKKHNYLPAA